jgi:hypothetical protein
MGFGYDIFKKLDDGTPYWLAQAGTLSEAKEKLEVFFRDKPAEYFVRDASTGKVVSRRELDSD